MAEQRPGDGFWGWLGRQVGHVKKAVKTDVTKEASAKPTGTPPEGQPAAPPAQPASEKSVVYREEKAEEVELPDQPGVVLRRTVIDEVIVDVDTVKSSQQGDAQPK